MGSGSTVPPRLSTLNPAGTLERSASGLVDCPSNPVGASREVMASCRFVGGESRGVDRREKLLAECCDDRTVNRHR